MTSALRASLNSLWSKLDGMHRTGFAILEELRALRRDIREAHGLDRQQPPRKQVAGDRARPAC